MSITHKIKTIGYLSALTTALMMTHAMADLGTIDGSAHDFTQYGWAADITDEICVFCHTPHNADTSVTLAPLWNHEINLGTSYLTYESDTLDALVEGPGGISLLCLSCHDGTIAVDAFVNPPDGYDGTGTHFISGSANLGTDLRDDHPISFDYDAAQDLDGALFESTKEIMIGSVKTKSGTIAELLLFGGNVECASCHDVHNTFAADDPLLKISNAASELCLTCHDK